MSVSERALKVWKAVNNIAPLLDLVEEGRKLEAMGRELAFRRDEPIGDSDRIWFSDLDRWHGDCRFVVRDLVDVMFTSQEYYTIRDLEKAFGFLRSGPVRDVIARGSGLPRKTPVYIIRDDLPEILAYHLSRYNEIQMELTGRSGIWLLGTMPPEQYTWSAFLNDFDSCFHQFLNWLTNKAGMVAEVAHRVYASTRSTPAAVESARMWREAVDAYAGWGLYAAVDYRELGALVRENKAEFRVGSAAGHATHAEFYPLYARAEYYDTDEDVHTVFIKLSEHYGCEILDHIEEEVTVVRIPRASLVDFFRGVLPFVTSMDFRLENPEEYWGKEFSKEYERLKDLDRFEREFRLCIVAYERLRREG